MEDKDTILIDASTLQHNYLDLIDLQLIPTWNGKSINQLIWHCKLIYNSKDGATSSGHLARMPNPDRALAEGDPLYTSWIDVFGDDVSGNRSKNWNKHYNIYISHRNLPRKLLQQEFHTHFVSTSPDASIPEQFHGIKNIIE